MLFHLSSQHLYHLSGVFEVRLTQDVQEAVVTEELLLPVFRLVKAVGIDEERLSLDVLDFLALVRQARPEADRCIRHHLQEIAVVVAASDNGRIMAGIAEVEVSRLQVDKSQEERDEHAALVILS